MQKTPEDKADLRWLVLILLLAFCIRVVSLEWGQGCNVNPVDSLEAYTFAVDYGLGVPKAQYIDQPNYNEHSKLPGPLWNMFCFSAQRFWGSVQGIMLAIILLNVATVGLVFLLAKRTFGRRAALWAALMMATLPFPVYYSLAVFNPNVMPFFSVLLCLALWESAREDFSPHIFWVGFLLLVTLQFHLSGLSLVPAMILILVLAPARLSFPWLLAGLLAGGLLYIPYVRGEMANGWQNTLGMTTGRHGHWWGGLKALIAPWSFLMNYDPEWTHGVEEYRRMGASYFGAFGILVAFNVFSAVLGTMLFVGVLAELKSASRGLLSSAREAFRKSPAMLFFGILLLLPTLGSLLSRQSFHSRYALVLFPALFPLVGYVVVKWAAHPRWARAFMVSMVILTCGNVWLMPAFFRFQGSQIEHGQRFRASFNNLEVVYQHLKTHAGAGHAVKVDDDAFRKKLTLNNPFSETRLIRTYVADREKESLAQTGGTSDPVEYIMCKADELGADTTAVAYQDHGFALVASHPASEKPQP